MDLEEQKSKWQEIAETIEREHQSGLSALEIADILNKKGLETRHGNPWGENAVTMRLRQLQKKKFGTKKAPPVKRKRAIKMLSIPVPEERLEKGGKIWAFYGELDVLATFLEKMK